MYHSRWELAGREMGKEFTTGDVTSKPELPGREMGRGIYHRRWASKMGTGR